MVTVEEIVAQLVAHKKARGEVVIQDNSPYTYVELTTVYITKGMSLEQMQEEINRATLAMKSRSVFHQVEKAYQEIYPYGSY